LSINEDHFANWYSPSWDDIRSTVPVPRFLAQQGTRLVVVERGAGMNNLCGSVIWRKWENFGSSPPCVRKQFLARPNHAYPPALE